MHMKNIFKSALALMAALSVAACNVDYVRETFTPDGTNNASFVQTVVSNTSIPAATATYNIPIARSDASSAQTFNLTSTLPAGVCPASVNFAAGEYETVVPLNLTGINVGTPCKGAITIADQAAYTRSSINVTLAKAYNWVSIGKGQFYDGLALQPSDEDLGIIECEVLQAEGFDRWRLMEPFPKSQLIAAWGASYVTYAPDSYIEFFVNDKGYIDFASRTIKTGLTYTSLGENAYIYYLYPSTYASSQAENDPQNTFVMDKVAQFYLAQTIQNTTSWFGFGAKYVSLPGGPDLNELLQ